MARLEGFEPPTAWFVARYSIQLSYRRVLFLYLALMRFAHLWPFFAGRFLAALLFCTAVTLWVMRLVFFLSFFCAKLLFLAGLIRDLLRSSLTPSGRLWRQKMFAAPLALFASIFFKPSVGFEPLSKRATSLSLLLTGT